MDRFLSIPIGEIHPSPTNPRKLFDATKLEELAQSIRTQGILQPLLVRPRENGYELVCGERRYRASKLAGLAEVPCTIRELSDQAVLEAQVLENSQRQDVHPLEEMAGFEAILASGIYGTGVAAAEELGRKIGKASRYVYDTLKYRDLGELAREKFLSGYLNKSHAVLLSRIPIAAQEKLLQSYSHWETFLPVRDLEGVINRDILKKLSTAPFDLTDPTLNPRRGACSSCPLNSANVGLLFPDNPDAAAGLCTDPDCLTMKTRVHADRRYEALKAQHGQEPLVLSERSSYQPTAHTRLDGFKVVDAKAKDAVPAIVVETYNGEALAKEIFVVAKTAGADSRSYGASSKPGVTAERKEELRQQKVETLARKRTFDAILLDFDGSGEFVERVSTSIDILRVVAFHSTFRNSNENHVQEDPHPGHGLAGEVLGYTKWPYYHDIVKTSSFNPMKDAGLSALWKAIFINATKPELLVADHRKMPAFVLHAFAKEAGVDVKKIREDCDWELLSKKARVEREKAGKVPQSPPVVEQASAPEAASQVAPAPSDPAGVDVDELMESGADLEEKLDVLLEEGEKQDAAVKVDKPAKKAGSEKGVYQVGASDIDWQEIGERGETHLRLIEIMQSDNAAETIKGSAGKVGKVKRLFRIHGDAYACIFSTKGKTNNEVQLVKVVPKEDFKGRIADHTSAAFRGIAFLCGDRDWVCSGERITLKAKAVQTSAAGESK